MSTKEGGKLVCKIICYVSNFQVINANPPLSAENTKIKNNSEIQVTKESDLMKIKRLVDDLNKTKIAPAEANSKAEDFEQNKKIITELAKRLNERNKGFIKATSEIKESNSKALAEVNSKVKELEQERNDLNKKVSDASNTIEALEKNLKEISQALSDAKSKIEKLKQEKSELQVEANVNKTMFVEMKESNAKALSDLNSKVKDLEHERYNLNIKELNDLTENKQALTEAKCEIEKLEKEKSELQQEAEMNKTKIEEMKELNSKGRKFKQKLAVKVFNDTGEDLESLLTLDLEELFLKVELVKE